MPARIISAQRKSLKPIIGLDNALDGTMILLDDIVQILDLSDTDGRFPRDLLQRDSTHASPDAIRLYRRP
jgi:hypothetical protein